VKYKSKRKLVKLKKKNAKAFSPTNGEKSEGNLTEDMDPDGLERWKGHGDDADPDVPPIARINISTTSKATFYSAHNFPAQATPTPNRHRLLTNPSEL